MSDQEIVKRSGGWEVPKRPDYDALEEELIENNFTFKRISGGADVYLDGTENANLKDVAARNGISFSSVKVTDGPHAVRVTIERKAQVRNIEDGIEHRNRIEDSEGEPGNGI